MSGGGLVVDRHDAETADGWRLELKRTTAPGCLSPASRPVLLVPGYGMNSFIFGFHPRGTSLERSLAEAGFEVWSANLRAQGGSTALVAGAPGPSLSAHAERDLPALIARVLATSHLPARRLDLVGCSLGGSIAYAHLALHPSTPVEAVVMIGAPLRWSNVHPVVRLVFCSPRLAERLVVRNARGIVRAAGSVIRRAPWLLSVYLNAAHVDLDALDEMAQSIEDPHPAINAEIARWLKARDLVVGGVNVTEALRQPAASTRPLLLVVSNRDRIVPESANLSALEAWAGTDVEVLRVGDDRDWYAHADLFIGDDAPRAVFAPIGSWLRAHNPQ